MRKSCTHLLYCRKRELIALTAHYVNVALCGCGISGIVRVRHYANELHNVLNGFVARFACACALSHDLGEYERFATIRDGALLR